MEISNTRLINNSFFHKGFQVRVKSKELILALLNEKGMTDGLPFMPEMFPCCGEIFKIHKCISRIFIEGTGVYEHKESFILEGVRCNGAFHRDCQRACNILWKKEWLESTGTESKQNITEKKSDGQKYFFLDKSLICQGQASVFLNYGKPLSFWDYKQYLYDIRTKNLSVSGILVMLCRTFFRRTGWDFLKKLKSLTLLKNEKHLIGNSSIKKGDLVEIRSVKEIQMTLNKKNKLKGLLFSEVMWKFCGKKFRVLKQIEHMINEQTGVFVKLSDTYLLNNNICDGLDFRGCPRECYWFWKKDWLKKLRE